MLHRVKILFTVRQIKEHGKNIIPHECTKSWGCLVCNCPAVVQAPVLKAECAQQRKTPLPMSHLVICRDYDPVPLFEPQLKINVPNPPLISTEQCSAVLRYLSPSFSPASPVKLSVATNRPWDIAEPLVRHVLGATVVLRVAPDRPARVLLAPAPLCSRAGNESDLLQRLGLPRRANSLHLDWFCSVTFQLFLLHIVIRPPSVHQDLQITLRAPRPHPGGDRGWGPLLPLSSDTVLLRSRDHLTSSLPMRRRTPNTAAGSGTCWEVWGRRAALLAARYSCLRVSAAPPANSRCPRRLRALPSLRGDKRSGTGSAEPAGLLGRCAGGGLNSRNQARKQSCCLFFPSRPEKSHVKQP